ncbi:glycosyltransferase WbuB [Ruminococcus sp. AM27-16]|nr:glycosyltransferase WbuB [Ruminococcus sp. AM27-16]
MNILFLSIGEFNSIYQREIYPDFLREFVNRGHEVYIVSSLEKRKGKRTEMISEGHAHLLKVKIGNITKTNLLEKGISTILVETQYKNAIKKYLSDVTIDLIIYSTPPITLAGVVKYAKQYYKAKTYLLLKDIFPQNAVDLGMLSKTGVKGFIYRFFRKKESKLYRISDHIGCMSLANVKYVLNNNPEIDKSKVEVCPNSIEVHDMRIDEDTRIQIRNKYRIPLDKKVLVYGGNLGKPQGIDFLIDCLSTQKENNSVYFLIVGDGTEYSKLYNYLKNEKLSNVKLMKRLPKDDYDKMIAACDVGMIFLDHRFTIPNFPSRLLAYMQVALPVLACTDKNTDIGEVIIEGNFGWWCESNNVEAFSKLLQEVVKSNLTQLGINGKKYLEKNYTVGNAYQIVAKSLKWM